MNNKPLLIFVHVPKTAGRSLHHVMFRQYADKHTHRINPVTPETLEAIRHWSPETKQSAEVIFGHFDYGMHAFFPERSGNIQYISFLREPVDRIISNYYYIKHRDKVHRLHGWVKDQSIREFLLDERNRAETTNSAVRQLSGVTQLYSSAYITLLKDTEPLPDNALELAKANVSNVFNVVGITELFDESLLVMSQTFGWKNLYYTKINVGKGKWRTDDEITPEVIDLIKEQNQLDLELYSFAKQRLQSTIAAQGNAFQNQLRQYQMRNKLVGPLLAGNYFRDLYGKLPAIVRKPIKQFILKI
jgi:hypothetical protein